LSQLLRLVFVFILGITYNYGEKTSFVFLLLEQVSYFYFILWLIQVQIFCLTDFIKANKQKDPIPDMF